MQLRTLVALVALVALGTAFASRADAQTATQTVTFRVDAINQMAVTGSPPLAVTTATAGSAPTAATATGIAFCATARRAFSDSVVMACINTELTVSPSTTSGSVTETPGKVPGVNAAAMSSFKHLPLIGTAGFEPAAP